MRDGLFDARTVSVPARRAATHQRQQENTIGVLRLTLALGVIVSHAPEMYYASSAQEPLRRVFWTMPLGAVCVDCFLLLSGFLLTKSVLAAHGDMVGFIARRVRRIAPGYVVAFLLSGLVLSAFLGGDPWVSPAETIARLTTLSPLHYDPAVALGWNGPLWTIGFEFRCYILLASLCAVGALRHRRLILAMAVTGLLASILIKVPGIDWRVQAINASVESRIPWFGIEPIGIEATVRLTTIFLIGSCCRLYEQTLRRLLASHLLVAAATLAMIPVLFSPVLAEAAVTTLGVLPFFWLALHARLGRVARVNASWDISYGVYLYAWPIGVLLRTEFPNLPLLPLGAFTVAIALAAGAASWLLVERRFVQGKHQAFGGRLVPPAPALSTT